MTDHTPPHDNDAEKSVLGSVMLSRDAFDEVMEVLRPGDFYRPAHEVIFASAVTVAGRGEPVDAVTVGDELARTGDAQRAGGQAYLHEAIQSVSVAANAGHHARIISSLAARRRLIEYATGLAQAASSTEGEVDTLISEAGSRLDSLTSHRNRINLKPLSETLTGTLEQIRSGVTPFEPTPWSDLNELIHGWRKGSLNIIGARPGGGKSIAGLQTALATARRKTVTYSVMEMDHDEVNIRLLAQSGNINMSSLSQRNLTDFEWAKVDKVSPGLMDSQLLVDDTPRQTIDHIKAHVRAASRKGELGLVVVDYLQQVKPPQHLIRAPRHEQVGHVAAELKALAFEYEVPVLAMAQVRRRDTPGPPQMSDLRESGDIETNADTVVLLHREDPESPDLQCFVRKARQGRNGDCLLGWQGEYARLLPIDEIRGWG